MGWTNEVHDILIHQIIWPCVYILLIHFYNINNIHPLNTLELCGRWIIGNKFKAPRDKITNLTGKHRSELEKINSWLNIYKGNLSVRRISKEWYRTSWAWIAYGFIKRAISLNFSWLIMNEKLPDIYITYSATNIEYSTYLI